MTDLCISKYQEALEEVIVLRQYILETDLIQILHSILAKCLAWVKKRAEVELGLPQVCILLGYSSIENLYFG